MTSVRVFDPSREEVRRVPCSSCGKKSGYCWGNGDISDFEHPARVAAARQQKFERWLAQHDAEVIATERQCAALLAD